MAFQRLEALVARDVVLADLGPPGGCHAVIQECFAAWDARDDANTGGVGGLRVGMELVLGTGVVRRGSQDVVDEVLRKLRGYVGAGPGARAARALEARLWIARVHRARGDLALAAAEASSVHTDARAAVVEQANVLVELLA